MQVRIALLVEDDPESRAALRDLLDEAHFAVIETKSGNDAIHFLTSNQPEPSLIVTDLAMPDMSGWELINVLQAYSRLASVPVLAVSAFGLRDQPVREEGVVEFFAKPIDPAKFIAAANRHAVTTREREARRSAAAKKLSMAPF
jgi:two-component system cell cycle response regulator DivK